MEFDNSNVINVPSDVYKYAASDKQIRIKFVSCLVYDIPLHINNGALQEEDEGVFIVPEVDKNIKSNTDYTINEIKTKQYNGQDIHDVTTLEGRIEYIDSKGNTINLEQFTCSSSEFKLPYASYSKYLKKDLCKINIFLDYAALKLNWVQLGEISGAFTIDQIRKLFSCGDYLDVEINNVKHKIRIADMGVDTIADTSKKANFTFEFVNAYSWSDNIINKTQWNEPGGLISTNFDYATSTVSNLINSEVKGHLEKGLGEAKKYLKSINRTYLGADNETSGYTVKNFNTTLFLPTAVNVIGEYGIPLLTNITEPMTALIQSESKFQYGFYAKQIGPCSIYTAYSNDRIKKWSPDHTTYPDRVWLATPIPGYDPLGQGRYGTKCLNLSLKPGLADTGWYHTTNSEFAIAPCFCF